MITDIIGKANMIILILILLSILSIFFSNYLGRRSERKKYKIESCLIDMSLAPLSRDTSLVIISDMDGLAIYIDNVQVVKYNGNADMNVYAGNRPSTINHTTIWPRHVDWVDSASIAPIYDDSKSEE